MSADSITYPQIGKGYYPPPCEHDQCGRPQEGAGRPRRSWIATLDAGHKVWHCSWHCLSRYAIRRELAGGDA